MPWKSGWHLEDSWDSLNAKLDAFVERFSNKVQLILDRIDEHIQEMRATTDAIVEEHRADRRLFYSMLGDDRPRFEALEQEVWPSRGRSSGQEP